MVRCRYLRLEAFRREIHEGQNVAENWNSANGLVFFGKGGAIASNRIAGQEISVLALYLVQASLVYVNTRMVQSPRSDPAWAARLSSEDYGGLTPPDLPAHQSLWPIRGRSGQSDRFRSAGRMMRDYEYTHNNMFYEHRFVTFRANWRGFFGVIWRLVVA